MRATKTGRSIGRPPGPHGTRGKYTYGCRCDDCREANRAYIAAKRDADYAAGLPEGDPRHGRDSTYTNRGCRCTACTVAHKRARAGAAA